MIIMVLIKRELTPLQEISIMPPVEAGQSVEEALSRYRQINKIAALSVKKALDNCGPRSANIVSAQLWSIMNQAERALDSVYKSQEGSI